MAMAIWDSVTVSMGLLIKGVLRVIVRVNAEVRSWKLFEINAKFTLINFDTHPSRITQFKRMGKLLIDNPHFTVQTILNKATKSRSSAVLKIHYFSSLFAHVKRPSRIAEQGFISC